MNILKQKVQNLYVLLKKSIQEFPVTIITIMLLTIIYALDLEALENYIEDITAFGLVFIDGTFLIETLLKGKEYSKKLVYYIISALVAFIFVYLLENGDRLLEIVSMEVLNTIAKIYACYLITLFTLAVYYNFKQSGKSFEEYVTNVFSNMFKTSIIYGILAIGVAIVALIFISLILDGEGYSLLGKVEILILGFYYFPTLIYSFCNEEEGKSKFLRVVIKYVLGILLISAFAIIYMYIVKIAVNGEMPSNQIFRILTALFILGMPIWTMIQSFNEEKTMDKISKALPLLFIPFIFLQMYSIGIRILNNGITISRYLCLMLIVFEIIYICMYVKNRKNIAQIFKVFIALTYIAVIVPFVNMTNVSNLSQYNNLKIFREKTDYTDEEKRKITGAFFYLKSADNGEKFINKLQITDEEKTQIADMESEDDEYDYNRYDRQKYVREYASIDSLDVRGYNKIYFIDVNEYYSYDEKEQKTVEEIFSNLELDLKGTHKKIYVNIYDKIKEYIANYDNSSYNNTFNQNNIIQLNNNEQIVIENFHVDYDEFTEGVESYSLEGYLLLKEDIVWEN